MHALQVIAGGIATSVGLGDHPATVVAFLGDQCQLSGPAIVIRVGFDIQRKRVYVRLRKQLVDFGLQFGLIITAH